MAKKSSIRDRANNAENRVCKYVWGEYRDWKEDHDKKGLDGNGNLWTCEVKNYAWRTGPKTLWTLLSNALEQAKKYDDTQSHSFSVYIPKNAEVQDSLVMYEMDGSAVITTLELFKINVLNLVSEVPTDGLS